MTYGKGALDPKERKTSGILLSPELDWEAVELLSSLPGLQLRGIAKSYILD